MPCHPKNNQRMEIPHSVIIVSNYFAPCQEYENGFFSEIKTNIVVWPDGSRSITDPVTVVFLVSFHILSLFSLISMKCYSCKQTLKIILQFDLLGCLWINLFVFKRKLWEYTWGYQCHHHSKYSVFTYWINMINYEALQFLNIQH